MAVEGGKGFSNHSPSFILWCFLIRPSQTVLFRGRIHYQWTCGAVIMQRNNC